MRELPAVSLSELESAKYRFSTMLRATPDAVFAELGDPSLWFPMVHSSVWKTGATSGVGAEREVGVYGFGRLRERMLAWDPPRGGQEGRVAFTMIGATSPMIGQMAEDMSIEPLEDGVRFHWNVVAIPTAIGRLIPQRLLLRGLFGRAMSTLAKRTAWSRSHLAATHGA